MSVLRPGLLTDTRDPGETKLGLSILVLCVLISVFIHMIFFIAWQIMDNEAVEKNFHFVMESENPQLEVSLTMAQDGQQIMAEDTPETTAEKAQDEVSPADNPEETGPEESLTELPENLSPEDLALLDAFAKAELLPASDEDIPTNTSPPMVAEPEAPTHKKYETAVRSAIGRKWMLPPEALNNFRPGRLIVNVTIDRSGNLLRFVIMESSGSASLDHAGLEALRAAAPFPPFPEEMAKFSQWDITMNFNYVGKNIANSRK